MKMLVGKTSRRFLILLTGLGMLLHCPGLQSVESQAADPNAMRQKLEIQAETPSPVVEFEATAYCEYGITKSGALTVVGVVAADPEILSLGSLIDLDSPAYGGIYQVLDTGALVKGKIIDIYVPGQEAAIAFGRQKVRVTVLRQGYPLSD
jgi:3D (Asp-Asp-Asp) domain-containing protein